MFETLWKIQGEVKDISDVNLRSDVVENVKIINNEFVKRIPNFTWIQVTENDYDKFLQHVYSRIYTFTSTVYLEEIEMIKSKVDDFVKCGSIENFREYKEVFENITYLLLMMDILLYSNKLKDIIDEIQNFRKTIKEKVEIIEKKEIICLIWKKLVELEKVIRENNSVVNKSIQNEEFEIIDKPQVQRKTVNTKNRQVITKTEKTKEIKTSIQSTKPPNKDKTEQKGQNTPQKQQIDKSSLSNQKEIDDLKFQIIKLIEEKGKSEKKTKELCLIELKKVKDEWNIEKKKLNDDINQLKKENTQIKIKNANLCQEDIASKKRIGELQKANQKLNSDGIDLQREAILFETSYKQLKTDNEASKKRIEELEKANQKLATDNKVLEKKSKDLETANQRFKSENEDSKKRIEEFQKGINKKEEMKEIKTKMKENKEKIGRIGKEKYEKKEEETEEEVIEKAENNYQQIIDIIKVENEFIQFIESANHSIQEITECYRTNQNEIEEVKKGIIDKIIELEESKMNRDLKSNPKSKYSIKGIFEDKKDIWNERRNTNESIHHMSDDGSEKKSEEELIEEDDSEEEGIKKGIKEENVEIRIPIAYYLTSTPYVCEYQGCTITIPIKPDTKDGDLFKIDIETNEDKIRLNCYVYCLSDGVYQRDELNLIVTLAFSKEHYGVKTTYPLQIGNREAIALEFEIKEGIIYESNEQGLLSNDGRKGSFKVIIQLV